MNLSEIEAYVANKLIRGPIESYSEVGSRLSVNGLVALPVYPNPAKYHSLIEIPILNSHGDEIAILHFTSRLYQQTINDFLDEEYASYITDVSVDEIGSAYQFKYDYVVVPENNLNEYLAKYFDTACVWGSFVHVPESPPVPYYAPTTTTSIVAIDNISIPTSLHREALLRTAGHKFAFERFLKLYHILELSFDYEIVEQIKVLDTDLKGVGELLTKVSSGELDRLRFLMKAKIKDVSELASVLNQLRVELGNSTLAKILIDFGKRPNPVLGNDGSNKLAKIFSLGGFDAKVLKQNSIANTDDAFSSLVLDIVSYIIYRIRCCIAHSRIGEYVMDLKDEHVVVDSAEPLLESVIRQVFS